MMGALEIQELYSPRGGIVFRVYFVPEGGCPGMVRDCASRAEAVTYARSQAALYGVALRSAEVIPLRKAVA